MTEPPRASDAERPSAAPSPATFRTIGEPISIDDVVCAPVPAFRQACFDACATGGHLAALVVLPADRGDAGPRELLAVLAKDREGRLGLVRTRVPAERSYPALTPELPQAQAFERQLFEEHGILPEGHPWLAPLRCHDAARRPATGHSPRPGPFFEVEGPGIHEVAVGPVHAGIIEPGHFRFQCSGETVLHLEILLGYQHRGARALLLRASPGRRLAVVESIAGDSVIAHATAYCNALEALSDTHVPLGAQAMAAIALELERIANHVGDLGALCSDIGYAPGAAWFGRLRGEFLNMLLEVSGNRFGRGLLRPGGVRFEPTPEDRQALLARLSAAERDLTRTAALVFGAESVNARFENTGVLGRETAESLGLVGPVARASGCDRDVRRDYPWGLYRFAHIPVALAASGDVMGRALVRWIETQRSLVFVREQLQEFRPGDPKAVLGPCRARSLAVSLVEGWRGEVVHLAVTGDSGELVGYEIFDPSFRNWFGLAMAMRGNQISDFPLCNKSFNLSYAGHDL